MNDVFSLLFIARECFLQHKQGAAHIAFMYNRNYRAFYHKSDHEFIRDRLKCAAIVPEIYYIHPGQWRVAFTFSNRLPFDVTHVAPCIIEHEKWEGAMYHGDSQRTIMFMAFTYANSVKFHVQCSYSRNKVFELQALSSTQPDITTLDQFGIVIKHAEYFTRDYSQNYPSMLLGKHGNSFCEVIHGLVKKIEEKSK